MSTTRHPLLDDGVVFYRVHVDETGTDTIGGYGYGGSILADERRSASGSGSPGREDNRIRRYAKTVSKAYTDSSSAERIGSGSEYKSHCFVFSFLSSDRLFFERRW